MVSNSVLFDAMGGESVVTIYDSLQNIITSPVYRNKYMIYSI